MIRVASQKQATAAFRSLEEHAISPRIWRPIGDAMLHDVNINTGTKRSVEPFATGAPNNFLDGEITSLGMFAVKESGGYPNFIGDFDLRKDLVFHEIPQCDVYTSLHPNFIGDFDLRKDLVFHEIPQCDVYTSLQSIIADSKSPSREFLSGAHIARSPRKSISYRERIA